MAPEKLRMSLIDELLVANDERHSYMQRMHTLAGPGSYTISSTFQRPLPNMMLRVVQRENYGREFSRQKRVATMESVAEYAIALLEFKVCFVTTGQTLRERRDQLRKLFAPANHWHQGDLPFSQLRQAGKVAQGSSRQQRASMDFATMDANSMESPPAVEVPCGGNTARAPQQHFYDATALLDQRTTDIPALPHEHELPRAAKKAPAATPACGQPVAT